MPRKIFNPNEWLNKESHEPKANSKDFAPLRLSGENLPKEESQKLTPSVATPTSPSGRGAGGEGIISTILFIEHNSLDITSNYADWLNIGFAFANEFAESGRLLFHRVSQFHPNYNHKECDRQYTNCLKSKGHGITIKTFFYIAKSAGIDISEIKKATLRTQNQTPNKKTFSTPVSPSPSELLCTHKYFIKFVV